MAYRPMVFVQGQWAGNACVFATREEAEAAARDIYSRWTLCEGHRADECDGVVNCEWDGGIKHLEVIDAV